MYRPALSRRVGIGLVTVLVLVVGCSAQQAATPVQPLTAEQRVWLDEEGPIRVGVPDNIAPAVVVDDGVVTGGWAWELTQLAALKVGADVSPVVYPTVQDTVAALREGEVHAVAGLSTRPDLSFATATSPLSWTPVVFAVGPGTADVAETADLAGRSVTTIPGSPIEERLRTEFPELRYQPAGTLPEALRAVYDGDTDLWAGPLAITSFQLAKQGRDQPLRVIGEPLAVVEVGIWAADPVPFGILQAGRERMTDTELSVIHVRWTGFDLTDPEAGQVASWVVPAMWVTVGLVVVLAGFTMLLRRRVAAATAELVRVNAQLEARVEGRTIALADANVRLLRSNDALTRFASRAAHDLRGPLAAIKGFSQLARRPDVTADMQQTSLETIETTTIRMVDLVDEMLTDATSLIPEAEASVSVAELRAWMTDFMAVERERHAASILLTSSHDPVDLSVTVLKQLLVNLIGNALKHGGHEGLQVDVTMTRGDGPRPFWAVDVDDDGQGVPEGQRRRIFDSGYRASTAGGVGSGLGLAACQDMVRANGGTIEADESPLGGLRVRLTLPATSTE